jgi:hypothetical protein
MKRKVSIAVWIALGISFALYAAKGRAFSGSL